MSLDDLFERIDPPRDGLARLRARLDAEEGRNRRRGRLVGLAAAAACAACVAGVAVSPLGPYQLTFLSEAPSGPVVAGRDLRSVQHPALVALGVQPLSETSVSVAQDEFARQVPVAGDDVIYYVVASVGDSQRPAETAWESGGSQEPWSAGASERSRRSSDADDAGDAGDAGP